jgi:hypothetical protein
MRDQADLQILSLSSAFMLGKGCIEKGDVQACNRAYAPKSFQQFQGTRQWDLPQIQGGPQIPIERNLLASLSRVPETGEANLRD